MHTGSASEVAESAEVGSGGSLQSRSTSHSSSSLAGDTISPRISNVLFMEPIQSVFGAIGEVLEFTAGLVGGFVGAGERPRFFLGMTLSSAEIDLNLSSADLRQNGPRFRRRIGSFGDGTANDDVACSSGDCFRGCDDADLVSVAGAGGTHAGSYDGELVS